MALFIKKNKKGLPSFSKIEMFTIYQKFFEWSVTVKRLGNIGQNKEKEELREFS